MFPERFSHLPAYAFPRLRALLDGHSAGGPVLHMTIGEPKHDFPAWIEGILQQNMLSFSKYPENDGIKVLRSSIVQWVHRRFGVTINADENVIALNGTREGLYNAAMALCPETKNDEKPLVLIPNPFYQVYMVAALSVNAKPHFVPATEQSGFLPDYACLGADVLNKTAIAYICSPSNPQGAVASRDYLKNLIELAEKFDFKIFADECYSEIYRDAPPVGALEVAHEMGADPDRVVIFHSLSKRSNLAGLRSGFAVSGLQNINRMKQLRAYAGAPLAEPLQHVAAAVWADEEHVIQNRMLYKEKFEIADQIFDGLKGYTSPQAGFFLWLDVKDGEQAALKLWQKTGVRVLPGRYLACDADTGCPGKNYIRVALVAPTAETKQGLTLIRDCLWNKR